jgi:hypothetical protein
MISPSASFCFHTEIRPVDQRSAIRIIGPSKPGRLLVDLACAQDNVEEQYADIDSEEELADTTLQDSSSTEENYEDLEWHHQRPSDKEDVH